MTSGPKPLLGRLAVAYVTLSVTVCAPAAAAQCARFQTSEGVLVFRLTPSTAPNAVRHFARNLRQKRYDGAIIYRVSRGSFAQGGIGYDKAMVELRAGSEGRIRPRNVRGAMGLARQDLADPGSGSTEFYWLVRDLPSLDQAQFITFAQVVSGEATLDRIGNVEVVKHYRYWSGNAWTSGPGPGVAAITWDEPAKPIVIHKARLTAGRACQLAGT